MREPLGLARGSIYLHYPNGKSADPNAVEVKKGSLLYCHCGALAHSSSCPPPPQKKLSFCNGQPRLSRSPTCVQRPFLHVRDIRCCMGAPAAHAVITQCRISLREWYEGMSFWASLLHICMIQLASSALIFRCERKRPGRLISPNADSGVCT